MQPKFTRSGLAKYLLVSTAVVAVLYIPIVLVARGLVQDMSQVRLLSARGRHVGTVEFVAGLLAERTENVADQARKLAGKRELGEALRHETPIILDEWIWSTVRREDFAGLRIYKGKDDLHRLVYAWHIEARSRGVKAHVPVPIYFNGETVGSIDALCDVGLRDDWIQRIEPPPASTMVVLDAAGSVVYERSEKDALPWSNSQAAAFARAKGDRGTKTVEAGVTDPALVMTWSRPSTTELRVVMTQPVSALMQPIINLKSVLLQIGAALFVVLVGAGVRVLMARECRVQLLATVADRQEQLSRAVESRTRFVEDAAHDLQGPLHTALLAITTIGTPTCPPGSSEASECLEMAADELRSASAGLRRLVMASRLETGIYQPTFQDVDIRKLIEEAVKKQNGKLVRRSVTCRLASAPVMVSADPDAVLCVLRNLLQNAVRYTPENASIRVSSEWSADGYQRISVEDSGPGVAPEHADHIFERFWRAPGAATKSGFGLGLAISKAYVEAHGGRIGVGRSDLGGAEFWFTLPPAITDQGV